VRGPQVKATFAKTTCPLQSGHPPLCVPVEPAAGGGFDNEVSRVFGCNASLPDKTRATVACRVPAPEIILKSSSSFCRRRPARTRRFFKPRFQFSTLLQRRMGCRTNPRLAQSKNAAGKGLSKHRLGLPFLFFFVGLFFFLSLFFFFSFALFCPAPQLMRLHIAIWCSSSSGEIGQ